MAAFDSVLIQPEYAIMKTQQTNCRKIQECKESKIMGKMIKAQDVFDEVITYYGWTDDPDIDIESKRKLLRNKYTFLAKNVVFRDRKNFKQSGSHMIPVGEAPIVRDLLIEAISTQEDNMICDWFNGRVDTNDSMKSILLFWQLKPIIMQSCMKSETDEVTMDEWLSTVKAAIHYNTAKVVLEMKRRLEEFRVNSLALNSNVHIGDIIATDEEGNRFYGMRGEKDSIRISGKTVEELLQMASTQNDYLYILSQILELFEADAKRKAIQAIKDYVKIADVFEANKADDSVGEEQLASEYVVWYQRIHDFLKENPDIVAEIEKETGAQNVLEFFRMQNR